MHTYESRERHSFARTNRPFYILSIHSHKAAHLLHSGPNCLLLEMHLETPPIQAKKEAYVRHHNFTLRRRYFGWRGMSPKVGSGSIFLFEPK